MRFSEIKKFKVSELLLDEGNYRFKSAKDQQACIEKIYQANQKYFKGLMESIAQDDLGEPLLVYGKKSQNIVMDGNRRLSVLKVLSDRDYSPNENIAEFAEVLIEKYNYKERKVQVQFSTDKELIAKTVFERHSGGKNGTTRIAWNAYAAARFGYDEKMGDSKDWRIMALLSYVETNHAASTRIINNGSFSYDVFRRIIRAALKKNIISQLIFTERGEKIKITARKDLVEDAKSKVIVFLESMKSKRLTLSRANPDNYADDRNINLYLSEFDLSPDNQELEDTKPDDNSQNGADSGENNQSDADVEQSDENGTSGDDAGNGGGQDDDGKGAGGGLSPRNRNVGIDKSAKVQRLLRELGDPKLKSLYYSLVNISLKQHPALMYVGAWSFWEVLARKLGSGSTDFPSYFSSRAKSFGFNEDEKRDHHGLMTIISKYGNLTKHSKTSGPETGVNLKSQFKVLDKVLVAALNEAIDKKEK